MRVKLLGFLAFLCLAPLAKSADWAAIQAAGLSFMDLRPLAEKTMAQCEKADLNNEERALLTAAYQTFRDVHLPQKDTVKSFVITSLNELGPEGRRVLDHYRSPALQRQLADEFLTERVSRDYCMLVFVEMLNGKLTALNFNDYANRIREYQSMSVPPRSAP